MLTPASWLYGTGAALRRSFAAPAWQAPVPVVCVGNFTAGGAGKTPVAMDIGCRLKSKGLAVHAVSRGYGGDTTLVTQVDPHSHSARDVGDEPLLLARMMPTWVSADRVAGVEAAVAKGAEAVVMDDGFQNPSVVKDFSLAVIDGAFGLGNGRLLPAGPLRESLTAAVERAQAIVLIDDDTHDVLASKSIVASKVPILRARIKAQPTASLQETRTVLAFAGIGRPEKFFTTLRETGYELADAVPYPDHHRYTTSDLADLHALAERHGAQLITTEKDFVRLSPAEREGIETLTITLAWEDETVLDRLLTSVMA